TGQCVHTPVNCDDGDACTIDSCDPQAGCTHVPRDCDDGEPCTADSCDPLTGQCLHNAGPSCGCMLSVNVELAGGTFAAEFSRCVRFELLPAGCDSRVIADAQLTFNGGVAAGTVAVPCETYSCVTARDPLHTLKRTIGPILQNGEQYSADFTGAKALVGGN